MYQSLRRRTLLKASLSAVTAASLPGFAFGQGAVRNRLEWNEFKLTSDYGSFINGIQSMRANANANDSGSWSYWSNIHVNACPHGKPYFLLWHRGYLQYFQEALRAVSGNSNLVVPYWDYYENAWMPPEFTDPSTGNPLYVSGRANTNVRSALSLTPFSSSYINLPRGMSYSFETSLEYKPHGAFHNVVGGPMATSSSPMDPIFWLHHGKIDRLWAAWVAAGAGRNMPAPGTSYWSGNLFFRSGLTMPRHHTYDTITHLDYTYPDLTMPTSLPPMAMRDSPLKKVNMHMGLNRARTPAVRAGDFEPTPPTNVGESRRSIGGARAIRLNESSVSAAVTPPLEDADLLEQGLQEASVDPRPKRPRYRSLQITLNGVRTLPAGGAGGFYYNVYLHGQGRTLSEENLVGSFGPFEIDSAAHHNDGRIVLPATRWLLSLEPQNRRRLQISFVRVNGDNYPRGNVISVDEVRLELSRDFPE